MSTISGTATRMVGETPTAVVGAKITVINSTTDEVAVNDASVKCVTTSGAEGAWSFTGILNGTYHIISEWDDGGTLYNALSKPYIVVDDTVFDPAVLTPTGWWDAGDAGSFMLREGTDRIESVASLSPGTLTLTQSDELRQPLLEDGVIKFDGVTTVTARTLFNQNIGDTIRNINAKFTMSFCMPKFSHTIVNQDIWNHGNTSGRNRLGRATGDIVLHIADVQIASFPSVPEFTFTLRVDRTLDTSDLIVSGNDVGGVGVHYLEILDIVTNGTYVTGTGGWYFGARGGTIATPLVDSELKEFFFKNDFVGLQELRDLHTYMNRHLVV